MSSGTAANCGYSLEVNTENIIKLGIQLQDFNTESKEFAKEADPLDLAGFIGFLHLKYGVGELKATINGMELNA